MSTSPPTAASRLISKSEFLSSLPPWRRLLAKLNWHPTVDAQLSAIEAIREADQLRNETEQLRNESEQLRIESEQLRNETELIKSETEQLRIENARLAKLESKLDLLLEDRGLS